MPAASALRLLKGIRALALVGSLGLGLPANATEGTSRALLIGINAYERLPALRGSINDVETMKAILVTRFGFPKENIRVLTDRQATRAGLLKALHELVDEAEPQDTVYIHYSGHGSRAPDLSGDEPDHMDETICPQDARTPGVADITDDELDAIISRLKVSSAVVVLDSCHSGTGLRDASLDIRARFVPPDSRGELYRHTTRAIVPLPLTERYLLFTGAAADQPTIDGPFDGSYHGLFTFALSRTLRTAKPGVTPRAVMRGVERVLEEMRSGLGGRPLPEPQLEGPADLLDRPLTWISSSVAPGGPEPPRLSWAEVHIGAGETILLRDGVPLTAQPESIWAVYPPGETRFAPGRALARLVVTETREKDAVAHALEAEVPIPAGSRAVLIAPAPPPDRVPILLRTGAPSIKEQLGARLETVLGGRITRVGPGQFARFVIDCESGNEAADSTCEVFGSDGHTRLARFRATPGGMAEAISVVIKRSMAVTSLARLANPSSSIRIEMRAVGERPAIEQPVGTRGVRVTADSTPHRLRFHTQGDERTDENSLQLEKGAVSERPPEAGFLT
jgi:hypothetical protein